MRKAFPHDGRDLPIGEQNLRQRTLRSASWVTLRLVITIPMQLVLVAVSSHLLRPEDIGVVGICMIVLTLSEVFSQTGFDTAIVRHQNDVRSLLHSAWSVQLLRGALLSLFICAMAYPIAWFQGEPRIATMLLVLSVVPLLDGSRSLGLVLFGRDLAQGKISLCEILVTTISSAVGCWLVYIMKDPWALVWNMLLFSLLRSSYGYFIHDFRPSFTLRWGPLRPFLRFGIFYNLSVASVYALNSVDRLIVGRMLGMWTLGMYDRGMLISVFSTGQFHKLLASTALPCLSKMLGEPQRFKRARRLYTLAVYLTFGVGAGIVALAAGPLVNLLFGEQYLAIVSLVKCLALYMALRGFTIGLQLLFYVIGHTRPCFVINLCQLAALLIGLPFAITQHGLMGAGWVSIASALLGLVLTVICLRQNQSRFEQCAKPSIEPQPSPTSEDQRAATQKIPSLAQLTSEPG